MNGRIGRPAVDTTSAFRQAFLYANDIMHLNLIQTLLLLWNRKCTQQFAIQLL